jgi:hypothetical protein
VLLVVWFTLTIRLLSYSSPQELCDLSNGIDSIVQEWPLYLACSCFTEFALLQKQYYSSLNEVDNLENRGNPGVDQVP